MADGTPTEDRPTADVPVLPIVMITLVQYVSLVPFLFNLESIPKPLTESFVDGVHQLRQGLVALGHAGLLVGAYQAWVARFSPRRPWLIGTLLLLLHATVTQMYVFHYVKLGAYPGALILEDTLADPVSVVSYVAAGMRPFDRVVVVVVLVALGVVSWVAVKNIALKDPPWKSTLLASGLAVAVGMLSSPVPAGQTIETLAGNGVPTYFWHMEAWFAAVGRRNDVAIVRHYLPPRVDHGAVATTPPEHILVVIADSMRDDRTPHGGYERNTLPELFAEADRWTRYPRAYSPGASTRTSLPPLFNSSYLAELEVDSSNATALWSGLHDAGYQTALFSASSLSWAYIAQKSGLSGLDRHVHLQEERSAALHHDGTEDGKLADAYRSYIEGLDPGTRTVTFVYLLSTHFPYFAPEEFQEWTPSLHTVEDAYDLETYTTSVDAATLQNTYDNGALFIDHNTSRMLAALDERGVLERSVVMLTSDHGEAFGEHGNVSHGQTLFEEQIHVPLLVRVGDELPELRGRFEAATNRVVGLVDLGPTLMALAGTEPPDAFQGVSMLSQREKPYEVVVCRHIRDKVAVIAGDDKYQFDGISNRASAYDLRTDPGELTNLWTDEVDDLAGFLEVLEARGEIQRTRP